MIYVVSRRTLFLRAWIAFVVTFVLLPVVALAQVIVEDGPISFPTQFDTDLLMWSALVAQFLPPVIGFVTKLSWSDGMKMATALLVCLAASFVTAFLLGKLDPANYITSALIVFTLTSVMYKQVWKGTKPMEALQKA